MTPDDLATLPVWAAAELRRQAEEIAALRAALEGAEREVGRLRDATDRMPVLLGALTDLEYAFRRGNFRETDGALATLWADYCAAARGVPHMRPAARPVDGAGRGVEA